MAQTEESEKILAFEILVNGQSISAVHQVAQIEVTQVSNTNFLASFTMSWSISPEFLPPTDINLGDGVEILAGYDSKLNLLFWGKISQVCLHGDASQGFYFTVDCIAKEKKLTTTAPTTEPELGVNILEIEISKNTTENTGYITIPGTNDVWVGYPIVFPFIGPADISEVKHLIEEGSWRTTIFTGQNTGYHKNKIVLQTSGGNSIVLDDTTNSISLYNGGSTSVIRLTPEGIQLKSDDSIDAYTEKSVTITSQENTNVVSSGNVKVSADEDLTLNGKMVHIN